MTISEQIYEKIKHDYEERFTQAEIAKKYNICTSVVQKLLTNARSVSGLRIESVERMFPGATLQFSPAGVNIYTRTPDDTQSRPLDPMFEALTAYWEFLSVENRAAILAEAAKRSEKGQNSGGAFVIR